MRLAILSVLLVCAVYVHGSSSFDDIAREQLWNLMESEQQADKPDEFFDLERRGAPTNSKYYLDAPKHPERLRQCVVCVGQQREKGLNVKQATAYCNKNCKRAIFDTRSLDDLFESY